MKEADGRLAPLIARMNVDRTTLESECLERATYLMAMAQEGQSTIAHQSMETLIKAAALIRSQDEELERLRGALGDLLEASERHIFGDECLAERLAARAALGETKAAPEQEQHAG